MAKKLGLALGAGGTWGVASLGVIKALSDEGIKIDYLAGSSMGSLIAGAYASNFAGEDTVGRIREILLNIKFRSLVSLKRQHRFGLFSSSKIGPLFEKWVGQKNIEDLNTPLKIAATDFKTGDEVIFDKGPLSQAVNASACFALIFTPFELDGKLYTDGVLSNPTPVDVVRKMGADIVIGVDVTSKNHLKRTDTVIEAWHHKILKYIPPIHYLTNRFIGKAFAQIIDITLSNLNREKIKQSPPDFLLTPAVTHMGQFAFKDTDKFIAEGERVAKEIIPKLRKMLE